MPKITPLPYQREGVYEIDDFGGRALLADEQGLGKTLQFLWWCKWRKKYPIVVICPANVKYMWQSVAKTQGITGYVLNGRKPEMPSYVDRPRLVIINYDILPQWAKHLRALRPQVVGIDECQRIKTRPYRRGRTNRGIQTRAAKYVCKNVPHVIGMSGTPFLNRPEEIYSTINIIRPDVFNAFRPFGMEFCRPRWTIHGIKYDGASNTDELNKLLRRTCMIRRTKSEVLKDLPPLMRSIVPVPIVKRDEYEFAKSNFLRWLSRQSPAKAQKASKAVALSQMNYLKRLCAKLKLRSVVGWINDYLENSDEKIFVGTWHHKMTDALIRRCNAKSAVLDGRTPKKQRQYAIDRFQRDKGMRLLIGNIQSAGVGIDGLQRVDAITVFAELPWRPADCTQLEARRHRIGVERPVWAYYLVAAGTIEERLCEILQEKQAVLSNVLDGGQRDDDLDVFSQLMEYLKDGAGNNSD